MLKESLREIGLSKNEAKVYVDLLSNGVSTVGEISQRTKIHRRNVYDTIENLKAKGFVSWTIRNNRKYFEAVSIERLMDILEEKKEAIKSSISEVTKNIRSSESVRVYTGIQGRKVMFEDKLRLQGEQLVLNAHEPSKSIERYIKIYHKMRERKRIMLRMIFSENEKESAKYFASNFKYLKVRVLPSIFTSPIAINIYSNKVAILTDSQSEKTTIIIEDEKFAENFRKYFNVLWGMSKEVN